MSLTGTYITSRQLIDEVMRDNQYTIEIPWEDAIEWIADAMELIKVPTQYIDERTIITVTDFRGSLPCNYHQITQVAGSFGGSYPFEMLDSSNTFHPTEKLCDMPDVFRYLNGENEPSGNSVEPIIGTDINGNPIYQLGPVQSNFAISTPNAVVTQNMIAEYATYKINDSFIFTNFQNGCVYFAYKAFPIDDEDGFPLIPDHTSYKKAVGAYVRARIDFLLWRKGDCTKDVYDDAETQWCWYVGKAQNTARIPTLDQMESIKNMSKLVQNRFHHRNFFRNLNS